MSAPSPKAKRRLSDRPRRARGTGAEPSQRGTLPNIRERSAGAAFAPRHVLSLAQDCDLRVG